MLPPNMFQSTSVFAIASAVVTGVGQALGTGLVNQGVPGRILVTNGEIAADACDCGQLAVMVTRVYMSKQFASDAGGLPKIANCPYPVVVADYTMQLHRCVVGPTDNNVLPAPDPVVMTSEAQGFFEDQYIMQSNTNCILLNLREGSPNQIYDYQVYESVPLGPQGDCGGIQLNFRVGWLNQCGCGGGP